MVRCSKMLMKKKTVKIQIQVTGERERKKINSLSLRNTEIRSKHIKVTKRQISFTIIQQLGVIKLIHDFFSCLHYGLLLH